MASEVDVANRALSKLGADRITAMTDNTKGARAMLARFSLLRDAELEAHPWRFAIKRAELPALSTAPVYGYARAFQRPADDLRPLMAGGYPVDSRMVGVMVRTGRGMVQPIYEIVGRTIETDLSAPLEYDYVRQVTNAGDFPALFVEALACRLAMDACEELTQSQTKKDDAKQMYRAAIQEARRVNALYLVPARRTPGPWITSRV